MNFQNWIELSVPVIGVIVAAVSAGLTYFFTKKQQILLFQTIRKKYETN